MMQTASKSSHKTKSTSTRTSTSARASTRKAMSEDAISMLMEDHAKVKKLFKQFEKLAEQGDTVSKSEIANIICVELTVHALAEEEVFYPVARMVTKDEDMMNEADVEHDSAKDLIAQIQSLSPDEAMYDAKVKVLGEYIDHHVQEEEKEMFPKIRKAKVDLEELGQRLKMKKEEILSDLIDMDGDINTEMLKKAALSAASKKH